MKRKLIRRNKQYLSSQKGKYHFGYNSWQRMRYTKMYYKGDEVYAYRVGWVSMWFIKKGILEELLK